MSKDYNVECLSCDFASDRANADTANKAAEAHVKETGHATITTHSPGAQSLGDEPEGQVHEVEGVVEAPAVEPKTPEKKVTE